MKKLTTRKYSANATVQQNASKHVRSCKKKLEHSINQS